MKDQGCFITGTQTFEGQCLIKYPTAVVDGVDVKLEVPSQYYNEETLTGLIKWLKQMRKQHRAMQAAGI